MRNLAQRSAEAAKNTASMIEESARRADNGVEMLDVTNEAANVAEAPLVMNTPAAVNDTAVEDAPEVPDEEQIQADADATGMTARVNRDAEDEAPVATNQTSTVSEEK